MTPFLKQVAVHYLEAQRIEGLCFIFPNRRSLVFFKKYLGDLLQGDVPLLVPPLYTINDFFYKVADARTSDRLRLLLELYGCYTALNPQAEPLDEFLFWGEVLLADFDDVDKYLVDARGLMQNVGDFKAIQDQFEYLSESQKEAIGHFLAHFRDASGRWRLNPDGEDVKARFLRLWNLLYPLYQSFNEALEAKGMAYEGKVYRALASRLKAGESVADILSAAFPEVSGYVFVGLNALNECERTVLARMRDAGLAEFVWDYVSPEIKDRANKSSFFLHRFVVDFPQAFPVEGGTRPEVTVISVPSSVGQCKLAPWILKEIAGQAGDSLGPEGPRNDKSVETAFVLPDEGLLLPLLNSIPEEYDNVNVTMGYPMTASATYALLSALGQMQLKLRHTGGKWYFYHRELREVLGSGLLKPLFTDEEKEVVRQVKAAAKYYVPVEDFKGCPLLERLFQPVVQQITAPDVTQNHRVESYFSELLSFIGRQLTQTGDLLELDFVARCHKQLNILQEMDLEVLPATHLRMLDRLLQGISVPFRGEPLQGLQVMGPLETRALDFRNLVILSANEGMFPRKSVSASFIPPELRKGFGLPTYEYQDAVWAYYFYRMIQRPEHVWLVYDNRTEGLKNGEESRYIKQLEYHFQWPLHRMAATAAISTVEEEGAIPKTQEHVDKVRAGLLSASTLQSYLACPAKFYYQVVEGLKAADEVSESLDAGMLGNVFHHVMQKLYTPYVISSEVEKSLLTRADLEAMRKDTARIRKLIRAEVLDQMHSIEVTGRNLVLENILQGYVEETLSHDLQLLQEAGSEGFTIIGLEQKVFCEINGFRFIGFVDRLDSYKPGEVRIVDYKTGKVEDNDILIDEENAAQVVEQLFAPDSKSRPKIALQLFLYDHMVEIAGQAGNDGKGQAGNDERGQAGPYFRHARPDRASLVNSIYSTARLYSQPLPDVPVSAEFMRLALQGVKGLLNEITDLNVPFRRTEDTKTCEYCDFKAICGR
ncbi:MAG: PD-(D/E)XK nuclease family protein [Bacteroidales bacterium]|nr:PD-(D/E)XK nuclease family protein [Bacteroidales bacterium]